MKQQPGGVVDGTENPVHLQMNPGLDLTGEDFELAVLTLSMK